MTLHTPVALITGLLLLLTTAALPTHAQEWAQEIEIITTVRYEEPLHIFVDSLQNTLTQNPEVQVKRSRKDPTPVSFATLRDELHEDGIALTSATHAFIRYRFEMAATSGIVETIEEMYFIYRGREDRVDLPILYLNTREPVVSDLIQNKGVPSPVNLKAVTTFRKMLAFPHLNTSQETAMVEIAGRPVREDRPEQEQILTEFLMDRVTLGTKSYVLEMPRTTVARVAASPSPGESQ